MDQFDPKVLAQLYRPPKDSHKGQNGKLLLIGGSQLFHAASMWSLEVASRIVDMGFYFSVPVNEAIVKKQKERFHDGIVVPQGEVETYLGEADCVLIGPGMERGKETEEKTNKLLKKYPDKRWVIDGGALQMMDPGLLNERMIVTPHLRELRGLIDRSGRKLLISKSEFLNKFKFSKDQISKMADFLEDFSKVYGGATVVLKGPTDVVCDAKQCVLNVTGNEGMTKGGTGDVLAGLVAALYCKSPAFLAASCGVYLNGLAGDRLYSLVGAYFNASDLVHEIPKVMAEVLG